LKLIGDQRHPLPCIRCPKADRRKTTQLSRSEALSDGTGSGRKRLVRFGKGPTEKRTSPYRPDAVAQAAADISQKQT
jgi:hypothetical protein